MDASRAGRAFPLCKLREDENLLLYGEIQASVRAAKVGSAWSEKSTVAGANPDAAGRGLAEVDVRAPTMRVIVSSYSRRRMRARATGVERKA